MFCQNCSAVETEDAKFCRDCGESLSEAPKGRKISPLRIWRSGQFLEKLNSLKILFDFSFRQSASIKIRSVYRLLILTAAGIAFASIAIGFNVPNWFGIITLFISASLTFLFMVAFIRVFLNFFTVVSRIEDQRDRREGKSESRDEIEWNIQ